MEGGIGWVAAVNVIVWTGLFLYLLRLGGTVRRLESQRPENGPAQRAQSETKP